MLERTTRSTLLLLFAVTLWACPAAEEVPPEDDAGTEADANNGGGEDAGGTDGGDETDGGETDGGEADGGADADGVDGGFVEITEKPWDIREMGDYWIGYGTDSITYVRAPDDTERTIKVAFWYPSRRTVGGTLARYTGVLARRGEGVRVRQGLELAREDGPFPLLIFSHGNAGLAEQNYFMTEHFASHGWIVASVEHTNNSISDTDGSINFRSAIDRPQDMSALLDWLEELPAGHILKDTMTDDVVMSGHSFGGLTTLANAGATFPVEDLEAACQNMEIDRRICELFNGDQDVQALFAAGFLDDRIKVAIPQAPASGQVYQDGTSAITMPTLMFTGGKDRSLPNAEDGDVLWDAMVGEQHMRVDVLRGGHFTFSNMCDILPGIELTVTDGCSDEFIDPPLAYDLINHYSMAFAYHHLYGDDSYDALLTGEEQPYADEIVVSRKSGE